MRPAKAAGGCSCAILVAQLVDLATRRANQKGLARWCGPCAMFERPDAGHLIGIFLIDFVDHERASVNTLPHNDSNTARF